MVATATMKVPLNLAADTASVAKLGLFKFVPFRLNRLVAEAALILTCAVDCDY